MIPSVFVSFAAFFAVSTASTSIRCSNDTSCLSSPFIHGDHSFCDESTGFCVSRECNGTAGCYSWEPFCNETTWRCMECRDSTDCDYGFCEDGRCQCSDNTDCEDGYYCQRTYCYEGCVAGAQHQGFNDSDLFCQWRHDNKNLTCDATSLMCIGSNFCQSASDCDAGFTCDEYAYPSPQCEPGCAVPEFGGANCTEIYGSYGVCNETSGECYWRMPDCNNYDGYCDLLQAQVSFYEIGCNETSGQCEMLACNTDEDCSDPFSCAEIMGAGNSFCAIECSDDSDCDKELSCSTFAGVCFPRDPCVNDTDCFNGYICNVTIGYCQAPPCDEVECQATLNNSFATCLFDGQCADNECLTDQDCIDASGGAQDTCSLSLAPFEHEAFCLTTCSTDEQCGSAYPEEVGIECVSLLQVNGINASVCDIFGISNDTSTTEEPVESTTEEPVPETTTTEEPLESTADEAEETTTDEPTKSTTEEPDETTTEQTATVNQEEKSTTAEPEPSEEDPSDTSVGNTMSVLSALLTVTVACLMNA